MSSPSDRDLRALHAQHKELARQYFSVETLWLDHPSPDERRKTIAMMLAQVDQFLTVTGILRVETESPFRILSLALSELDRGHVDPILKPRPGGRTGRPPDTALGSELKALAVATMDFFLQDDRMTRPEAARKIGNVLGRTAQQMDILRYKTNQIEHTNARVQWRRYFNTVLEEVFNGNFDERIERILLGNLKAMASNRNSP